MQFNYTIMFCHIPGLVCQDRPPMNIFLEKKDDSIRLVVQSRVVGGRGSGDCRQRVTSGTILQPPAQSPILGGRCHHTSTIEQHPFLFIFFFREHVSSRRARRLDLPIANGTRIARLPLGPAPSLHNPLLFAYNAAD